MLHRATHSWDGTPYTHYPQGQPVLYLVKVDIPAHTTLDWHCHPALNMGYVAEGTLEVEARDGKRVKLVAGDTLAELVGDVHRGHTAGQPATVLAFHAATDDQAISIAQAQCPPRQPSGEGPLGTLLGAIEQRLASAEPVALHKWDNTQPVQDSEREQQVQADVRNNAWRYQLPADRAAAFFADQIEAHKMLQYRLLNHWHSQGQAPDSPRRDLQGQLRPELDALQVSLLQSLASFDSHPSPNCAQHLATAIDKRALPPSMKQAVIRATGQLCDKS
ncbi:MAG: chorismate mutase [Pseudomonas sp.]